jgi:hypothetical protein
MADFYIHQAEYERLKEAQKNMNKKSNELLSKTIETMYKHIPNNTIEKGIEEKRPYNVGVDIPGNSAGSTGIVSSSGGVGFGYATYNPSTAANAFPPNVKIVEYGSKGELDNVSMKDLELPDPEPYAPYKGKCIVDEKDMIFLKPKDVEHGLMVNIENLVDELVSMYKTEGASDEENDSLYDTFYDVIYKHKI